MKMVSDWQLEDMPSCELPREVNVAFEEAFTGFTGATYTPIVYVASLITSGITYAIICKRRLPLPDATDIRCQMVVIYKPLNTHAQILKIEDINF